PELVEDRLGRADRAAGTAVDADLGVDDVEFVAETGDRLDRALLHAGRTADTGLNDLVGQSSTFRWIGSARHVTPNGPDALRATVTLARMSIKNREVVYTVSDCRDSTPVRPRRGYAAKHATSWFTSTGRSRSSTCAARAS